MCAGTLLVVLSTGDSEEALLYCVGALKFLSGNSAILRLLLDHHCMSAAQKLVGRLCGAEATRSAMAGHILVQVQPGGGAWMKWEQWFPRSAPYTSPSPPSNPTLPNTFAAQCGSFFHFSV